MEWKVTQVEPCIDADELSVVSDVISRGWLTEGPCAEAFLDAIKKETGAPYAVLAPNGTLALFLALLALDLPRDGEIVIPAFTFYASASAAVFAGLRPVFADVDPETFSITAEELESRITERTVAVMPVHVYGHSAEMDALSAVAARHGIAVVEDAAQAYGVNYRGRHAATWGDAGIISFFADKTITTGEGGVVLANDPEIFERLRLLRNQGRVRSGTFKHEALGMNFRVTDLQCAVGLAQVGKFASIAETKRRNHVRYVENLRDIDGVRWLRVQPGSDFVPFRFALLSDRRAEVDQALERAGVQTRSFFYPLHLQPPLAHYANGALPNAERLHAEGICLPVHTALREEDIDMVCDIIREVHEGAWTPSVRESAG